MNKGTWYRSGAVLAAGVATAALVSGQAGSSPTGQAQPVLGSRKVPIIVADGLRFRDLDRDGKLTPYEDWRLPPERRAADLVSRMSLEEKAGAMLHPVMGSTEQITQHNISSVLTRSDKDAAGIAEEDNNLQAAAETTRLGIPVTVSSDPRYVFRGTFGQSVDTKGFTKWPDSPGWAANHDLELVRHAGEIIAREYRAVGIGMALSPQADVATEPRWSRVGGTFGEDFHTVGITAAAYIEGIQGSASGLRQNGVAAIVKHFAGYGAAKDGWDSHSRYGRFATYPGGQFKAHLATFRPSLDVRVAGVMPTYSILQLPGFPQVGGAFNKVLLDGILRKQEGYKGLVLSDWSVTEDCKGPCVGEPLGSDRRGLLGKPWGVEDLSRADRFVMAVNAGVDQLGYDSRDTGDDATPIVEAVRAGKIAKSRVDEAVRRIMTIKFGLGLFENPFVDVAAVPARVGQADAAQLAARMQQNSLVLLENKGRTLPIKPAGKRVFLRGVDRAAAERAGFVVTEDLNGADLAIVRTAAPYKSEHQNYLFGRMQHEGDLDFKPDNADFKAIQEISARVPTIVTVYLERPAILTNLRPYTAALIGNFGATDEVLLNLITGRAHPRGKLPFELPSSMAAVRAQKSDVAHDSAHPLYRIGYGLSF